MIVRGGERVLVQGITGKQGTFWTERMQEYGTRVVAGVNPKRAGVEHCGVPVFASAREAMRGVGFDVSVLFIPPLGVKAAAIDAIEAGCPRLVVLTEHVPVQDVMEVLAAARTNGAAVAGPNTAGLVTPGECFVGFMPAFEADIFRPGRVGVVSRSGSLGTLVCLNLVQAGFGESAFVGIGGDPIVGTTTRAAVAELDADERTDSVVVVGEIGGAMEEEAAEYIRGMNKPVVAFIAGGFAARKEDGARGGNRDGRQGLPCIQAPGARGGRGRGARHPIRRRGGTPGRARLSRLPIPLPCPLAFVRGVPALHEIRGGPFLPDLVD